jgi:hypothetical protein
MDWVSCAGDINITHTPFPPTQSPPNKKIKYNKILTYIFAINISGNSPFGTLALRKNAERYEW